MSQVAEAAPSTISPPIRGLQIEIAADSLLRLMIPIYTPSGSYLRHIDTDALQAIGNRAKVIRNRRGHAKRAILRGVDDQYIRDHQKRQGEHFEQDLGGIKVHALHGIRGSN